MISKELLSEVLESQVDFICDGIVNESFIRFYLKFSNQILEINVYELAHKCKEWAVKEGYTLIEYAFAVELYNEKLVLRCCKIIDKTTILFSPLRVFKACQWILDNKEANK